MVYGKDFGSIIINGKELQDDEFGAKILLGVVYQNSVLVGIYVLLNVLNRKKKVQK